jgi:hypothetical protein
MRTRPSTRARRRRRPAPAPPAGRSLAFDRWAATIAVAVTGGLFAAFYLTFDPWAEVDWVQVVLPLSLLFAAGAGRALLGFRAPPQPAGGSAIWDRSRLLPYCIVAAAAAIPYLAGLTIGFLGDDFVLAAAMHNAATPSEAAASPVFRLFFRPLTLLVWWLGMRLGDAAPLALSALAIAVHVANSILVYAVGRRLIGSVYGAALAAVLFAVHPLHVEPILWKCALSDLLATSFALLSLLALDAYLAAERRSHRYAALVGAGAAFLLALLSKEAAIMLPAFVALRLALLPKTERRGRVLPLAAASLIPLAVYLPLRLSSLGHLSGYAVAVASWKFWLPIQALSEIGSFFFPFHTGLLAPAIPPWVRAAAVALMALGLIWCARGLIHVPGRRIWLWIGFLFIAAAATSGYAPAKTTMYSARFAYLPTIGLVWLFGDVCAGRGTGWRPSGAIAALTLLCATTITLLGVGVYREADRLTGRALSAAADVVEDLPDSPQPPVLYLRDLPPGYLGAPVFFVGFPEALSLYLDRPVSAYMVWPIATPIGQGTESRIDPDVLEYSILGPGEYVAAWRPESETMEIIKVGKPPAAPPRPESGQ